MALSYRARRRLRRILVTLLVILLAALLIWGCWMLWLHKFVYYTADGGAVLDLELAPISGQGELAQRPQNQETIPIYYNEGESVSNNKELTQLNGYYISSEELVDISAVRAQLRTLAKDVPIMLDVKTIYGSFNYSSSVTSSRNSKVDTKQVDSLIKELNASGRYVIARMPAFRDKEYGLNHVDDGVFHSSRGYLWMDDNGCYWLNPAREGTLSHVSRIIHELRSLGFDEVVLYDFRFPETDNIYFDGSQSQAVTAAAQTLLTSCGTDSFAVSFVGSSQLTMPQGRSRLYLENAAAADAAIIAQSSGLEDPEIRVVFMTDVHDTRFDAYSVLRPLSAAH